MLLIFNNNIIVITCFKIVTFQSCACPAIDGSVRSLTGRTIPDYLARNQLGGKVDMIQKFPYIDIVV